MVQIQCCALLYHSLLTVKERTSIRLTSKSRRTNVGLGGCYLTPACWKPKYIELLHLLLRSGCPVAGTWSEATRRQAIHIKLLHVQCCGTVLYYKHL